ncbi:MAG: HD-GYP domain-containing protein [Halanaerobiaceae bacterium]
MRIISVENITPDLTLARPVFYKENILLNKGVKDLHLYKHSLLSYGINYVYIEDNISHDIEINDVIHDETRQNGRLLIEKTINDISLSNKINVNDIKELIYDMIDEILSIKYILVNLIDIKSYCSYTFAHSVNVAAIAIFIGKLMGLDKDDLIEIGIGSILHDIGKMLLPMEIIHKPHKLTAEEYKIIRKHPLLGYQYVKDNTDITPRSRIIILSHHERMDGSGYPKGIAGEDIHIFARVAAIADVFDALTSDRIYRKKWSNADVVDYLISNANSKFDQDMVEHLSKNVAIFPNGLTVILSNGCKAVVKEQNKNFPQRPIVRLLENKFGDKPESDTLINLMEKLDVVIIDTI